MKKIPLQLFKVAAKFQTKYASIDASTISEDVKNALQTAIGNASTVKSSGILPFVQMAQQSNSSVTFTVTRNGNEIGVSNPIVSPGSEAPRYSALPMQIQGYLEGNLELFPTQRNGESVSYNNFTVTLTYGRDTSQSIAKK